MWWGCGVVALDAPHAELTPAETESEPEPWCSKTPPKLPKELQAVSLAILFC